MPKVYYDEDSDPNDAPGLQALALGCLLFLSFLVAAGALILFALR